MSTISIRLFDFRPISKLDPNQLNNIKAESHIQMLDRFDVVKRIVAIHISINVSNLSQKIS